MQRELWTDACNAESARFRLVNEARREGLENTFGFITVALTKTLQERVMNYDVGASGLSYKAAERNRNPFQLLIIIEVVCLGHAAMDPHQAGLD